MTDETVSATTRISASAETVFVVLTDPSRHAANDGTGRVRDSLDGERLTGSGQIFRVDMYHENHPDGSYEMANQVLAFEPPRAISWRPGVCVTVDRRAGVRRLGLALRPDPARSGDRGHPLLRLVRHRACSPPAPPVPAVRTRSSRQLVPPLGRDGCEVGAPPRWARHSAIRRPSMSVKTRGASPWQAPQLLRRVGPPRWPTASARNRRPHETPRSAPNPWLPEPCLPPGGMSWARRYRRQPKGMTHRRSNWIVLDTNRPTRHSAAYSGGQRGGVDGNELGWGVP
jgi:hypothetical protein